MNFSRRVLALAAGLLAATPASAHHVVWLDFASFNLNSYPTVNGHAPATSFDLAAIRELIIANMVEDYAAFDLHFTTSQPNNGRYTLVKIFGASGGGLFGNSGPPCQFGNCTGIGTWVNRVSACEIYAGTFASDPNFSGANATTARIANGISHTASHELGHVLGLFHCHAADDFVASGSSCADGFGTTTDSNVNWHIMASGASTVLTGSQRATRDRFFSVHSSRRVLMNELQPRNHAQLLGNYNGGSGRSDLAYGRLSDPFTVQWLARLSLGSSFGDLTTWSTDIGERMDIFLTGDVNGDSLDDLVVGELVNSSTVRWQVATSTGSAFNPRTVWVSDGGDAGDIFRVADVNGDGRKDLVYGRPVSATQVTWFVRLSTGTSFGTETIWASDAGDRSDLFFVRDVNGDGRADLVAVGRGTSTTTTVYTSTGLSFTFKATDSVSGFSPDYVLIGDVTGDRRADFVAGSVFGDTTVQWNVRPSTGCVGTLCFGSFQRWSNDAGDAGDLFRLGDGDGDGRVDLFYGEWNGMSSRTTTPDLSLIQWFGRFSLGTSWSSLVTWSNDAGDEGDIFP